MKARAILQRLHRWIGLPFAILLLLQGASGVVIAFRAELNRALHRSSLVVVPHGATLPVQQLLDLVRAAHQDLRVSRIEFTGRPEDAVVFRLQRGEGTERYVAVDPYRGVITRDAALAHWPVQWIFEWHYEVHAGVAGKNVVGINGIVLVVLVLSGPFLWWPGRRSLARGLRVTFDKGIYRGMRDSHKVAGILVAALLLVSGVTGIVMTWKIAMQPMIGRLLPISPRPAGKVALQPGVPVRPVDELIDRARARYDHAQVRNVRFPTGDGREVTVFLEAPEVGRPRASNQFAFNGYTGELLSSYEARSIGAGSRLIDWMLPIHTGEALGFGGRVLFLFSGMTLCLLAVTGAWQWFARRRNFSAKGGGRRTLVPSRVE